MPVRRTRLTDFQVHPAGERATQRRPTLLPIRVKKLDAVDRMLHQQLEMGPRPEEVIRMEDDLVRNALIALRSLFPGLNPQLRRGERWQMNFENGEMTYVREELSEFPLEVVLAQFDQLAAHAVYSPPGIIEAEDRQKPGFLFGWHLSESNAVENIVFGRGFGQRIATVNHLAFEGELDDLLLKRSLDAILVLVPPEKRNRATLTRLQHWFQNSAIREFSLAARFLSFKNGQTWPQLANVAAWEALRDTREALLEGAAVPREVIDADLTRDEIIAAARKRYAIYRERIYPIVDRLLEKETESLAEVFRELEMEPKVTLEIIRRALEEEIPLSSAPPFQPEMLSTLNPEAPAGPVPEIPVERLDVDIDLTRPPSDVAGPSLGLSERAMEAARRHLEEAAKNDPTLVDRLRQHVSQSPPPGREIARLDPREMNIRIQLPEAPPPTPPPSSPAAEERDQGGVGGRGGSGESDASGRASQDETAQGPGESASSSGTSQSDSASGTSPGEAPRRRRSRRAARPDASQAELSSTGASDTEASQTTGDASRTPSREGEGGRVEPGPESGETSGQSPNDAGGGTRDAPEHAGQGASERGDSGAGEREVHGVGEAPSEEPPVLSEVERAAASEARARAVEAARSLVEGDLRSYHRALGESGAARSFRPIALPQDDWGAVAQELGASAQIMHGGFLRLFRQAEQLKWGDPVMPPEGVMDERLPVPFAISDF